MKYLLQSSHILFGGIAMALFILSEPQGIYTWYAIVVGLTFMCAAYYFQLMEAIR